MIWIRTKNKTFKNQEFINELLRIGEEFRKNFKAKMVGRHYSDGILSCHQVYFNEFWELPDGLKCQINYKWADDYDIELTNNIAITFFEN